MAAAKSLIHQYIKNCLNSDGGYAFAQGVDSNAQDTYFALAIMNLLSFEPEDKEKTVEWLTAFPRSDIRSSYYTINSLVLLDGEITGYTDALPGSYSLKIDTSSFSLSEFESLFMYSCLARLFGRRVNAEEILTFLMTFENKDGGFGQGHSTLTATHHAISTLINTGYNVHETGTALKFVKACESPGGGFSSVPNAYLSFIEDTYSAIALLEIYGVAPAFPQKCIERLNRSFSSNGGFVRAEFGIPTLENTYYATFSLRKLHCL